MARPPSSALSYVSTFPTEASRHQLAVTTAGDTGLVGPARPGVVDRHRRRLHGLQGLRLPHHDRRDLGAARGHAAAARRGGHRSLAVACWPAAPGRHARPSRPSAALGAAIGVIVVGTTLLTLLAGRNPDVGFGVGAIVALRAEHRDRAGGVRCGWRASPRSSAARAASATGIGIARLRRRVRAAHDRRSGPSTRWLRWTTPFGWTELMQPFTANDLRGRSCPRRCRRRARRRRRRARRATRRRATAVSAVDDVAPLGPSGCGSPFGLTARLELPGARPRGARASRPRARASAIVAKAASDACPESLERHARQVRRAGSFATPVLRRRVPARRDGRRAASRSQVGAAGEEETSGASCTCSRRPRRRTPWFVGRLRSPRRCRRARGLAGSAPGSARRARASTSVTTCSAPGQRRSDCARRARARRGGAGVAPRAAAASSTASSAGRWSIDLLASLVSSLRGSSTCRCSTTWRSSRPGSRARGDGSDGRGARGRTRRGGALEALRSSPG